MKNNRILISSKLKKTRVVLRDHRLARYVPSTRTYSKARLRKMLDRYHLVYMKPNRGSLGVGVMRVEKRGGTYKYQAGTKKRTFSSFRAMVSSLQQRVRGKSYLVQKGIRVLKRNRRPFDFRVVIQKNHHGVWEPTGAAGRVAHPRKAVTNGSQGGTIFSVQKLLRPHAGSYRSYKLMKKMNRIARLTATQFSRAYPAVHELGLDIAVDRNLYPWILEVNTSPDPCPFTKLRDKSMIRKIVAYGRANGRRYSLHCSRAKSGR
ncbi:YheC/YheD family protein [Paenibacillus sp. H1-7]|uniref:YheC/YheD family protein n=1 Tax=Paenibacillus sp. H1-7 TaxID=2282849 RepID=UPI001EF78105|nr:YheC/YheD family protein [Paenibacillus sp. H1-7]ULL19307.1 YheC/YheD family protein [Paenibacillus sp. H1-7]